MARLNVMPAQPPMACTTRPKIRTLTFCAVRQISDPTTKMLRPVSSTGRRPNRSDSGPMINWPIAMAAR
jgi:hypothetical protein